VAVACSIWSVSGWLDWRRGDRGALPLILHVVATALAVGSKESAILLAPLLTAWALLDRNLIDKKPRLLVSIVPVWLVTVALVGARPAVLRARAAPPLSLGGVRLLAGGAAYLHALIPPSSVRHLPLAQAQQGLTLLEAALIWAALLTITILALKKARRDIA